MFCHESWPNEVCRFRAMTIIRTVSFTLIIIHHIAAAVAAGTADTGDASADEQISHCMHQSTSAVIWRGAHAT